MQGPISNSLVSGVEDVRRTDEESGRERKRTPLTLTLTLGSSWRSASLWYQMVCLSDCAAATWRGGSLIQRKSKKNWAKSRAPKYKAHLGWLEPRCDLKDRVTADPITFMLLATNLSQQQRSHLRPTLLVLANIGLLQSYFSSASCVIQIGILDSAECSGWITARPVRCFDNTLRE